MQSSPGCGFTVEAGPQAVPLGTPCRQLAVHVDLLGHRPSSLPPPGSPPFLGAFPSLPPPHPPHGFRPPHLGAGEGSRNAHRGTMPWGHPGHPKEVTHHQEACSTPTSPPPQAQPPAQGPGWRTGGQTPLSGAGQTHSPDSGHADTWGDPGTSQGHFQADPRTSHPTRSSGRTRPTAAPTLGCSPPRRPSWNGPATLNLSRSTGPCRSWGRHQAQSPPWPPGG